MHEYAVLVNVTTVVCHTFRDRGVSYKKGSWMNCCSTSEKVKVRCAVEWMPFQQVHTGR